jgi:hypothetical protein
VGDPFAVLNRFGFMTYLGGVYMTPNSAQPLSCRKTNRITESRFQRKLPCGMEQVRTRKVFYVEDYDPQGAGGYYGAG